MSAAPSTPKIVFTSADLNPAARDLLSRVQAYVKNFDAWEPRYKPRCKIEPAGEALLLHREIDRWNDARYRLDIDVEALDDMDAVDVNKVGEA